MATFYFLFVPYTFIMFLFDNVALSYFFTTNYRFMFHIG
jgi:hypothetical protein